MSFPRPIPQQETLRAEVTARTEAVDPRRRTAISKARLVVYSAGSQPRVEFGVTLKGPTWHDTGLPPFGWQFTSGDLSNGIRPVLRIFLSRAAYIEDLQTVLQLASLAFQRSSPAVRSSSLVGLGLEVIRVADSGLIPELGRTVGPQCHGFTPTPWSQAVRDLWEPPGETAFQTLASTYSETEPLVSSLPNGLMITRNAGGGFPAWQVRIIAPQDQPAAFSYNLFGPRVSPHVETVLTASDRTHISGLSNQYTLRVVKTPNVGVELAVETSRGQQALDVNIEYHVVNPTVSARPGEARLIVPDGPVDPERTADWNYIGLVPPLGTYLNPELYQFYNLTHHNRDAIPGQFQHWNAEALTREQVVGDPIRIRGRRPGERLGRVAPRLTTTFSPELEFAIAAFEFVVSMVPIIGTIYDIASLVHLSTTGRSLWGETRDISVWDVIGIGCLGLGVVQDAASLERAFSRAAALYTRGISRTHGAQHLIQHLDPPLRRAAAPAAPLPTRSDLDTIVTRRQVREMTGFVPEAYSVRGQELAARATANARKREARVISDLEVAIDEFGTQAEEAIAEAFVDAPGTVIADLLGASSRHELAQVMARASTTERNYAERFVQQHERSRLLSVFAPNLSSFSDEILLQGHRAYNARRVARGLRTVSAVEWAVQQTSGRYIAQLRFRLGNEAVRRIRRAQALGTLAELNEGAATAFAGLRREIIPYRELVQRRAAQSTGASQLGAFFDADHLLEKRFITRLRERLPDFDIDSLNALLVPRNQSVLAQLKQISPGVQVYDHTTKTQLLRAMIPYLEHNEFSIQQWWDTHVWVYRQLATENFDEVADALEHDFSRLSSALNESFSPRRSVASLDLLPRSQIVRASSFGHR